jgi:hypothetical protein
VRVYPLKAGTYSISSGFGNRAGGFHYGLDFAAKDGTKFYACQAGTVQYIGAADGYGQWIVIDSDDAQGGGCVEYGHMWDAFAAGLKVGSKVAAGQHIGYVGSNGGSTGPHLHITVWPRGHGDGARIDPAGWLKAAGTQSQETNMGDPVWLADVLRAEGVATVEYGDWKNHGHGDFGNIWGIVAHHTGASGNSGAGSIANGRPDLPGPVSQIYLARNGVASVVAAGIAWHAGSGRWPGIRDNGANQVTIGIEADNNGTEGWSAAQYWAYVKVCAAICRRLGVRADRVIGHKEWAGPSQGKWDPGGIDMNAFRRDIQNQIDGGAKPPPPPVVNQIDEMQRIIEKSTNWLGARVGKLGEERTCGVDGKGRYAQFERGYIYWHPKFGARAVPLRIFQYWAGLNWENGPLGYPVKNHTYIADVGDIQAFERGVVFRKLGDDPGHHVTGAIGDSYYQRGAEARDLGWPTSNEYDFDGGKMQDFEHDSLAWNPSGAVRITRKKD